MVAETIVGPFDRVALAGGASAPWYVIAYDKNGACASPQTRDHLLRAVRAGEASHVVIFSHGWNNTWEEVRGMAGALFRGLASAGALQGADGAPARPIFVSIFWPSIALLLPEEQGPRFAAGDAAAQEASDRLAVESLAAAVPARRRERLRELAGRDALTPEELRELARIIAPLLRRPDEVGEGAPSADELVGLWRSAAGELEVDEGGGGDFGFADDEAGAGGPEAAGGLIDWVRLPFRMATVWQMKDRAGVVGARGVSRLLRALLAARPEVRVHLAGHSYGCRVMLSAICAEPLPRPVESLLLLQPAISHLCFAERIAETGRPGGYRAALERVAQPILSTFSSHDDALHNFFHLAVRRPDDLGEARIAGAPPSRYAALGGYGPGGVDREAAVLPIRPQGDAYDLSRGGKRLLALDGGAASKPDGTPAVSHHGDINHPMTWWMLYSQVAAS